MVKTLIDGQKLQDRLSKRLVGTADLMPPGQLSDVLKAVLTLREQTRSMLVSSNIPIDERDRLLEKLEGITEKYFVEVAVLEKSKLPPELAEILHIQQMVEAMVENKEREFRPVSLKPLKKGPRRKIVKDEEESAATKILYQQGGSLDLIMLDLVESDEYNLDNEEDKMVLKFEPFIRMARQFGLTPEMWMDCREARKICAIQFVMGYGVTEYQAAAFYAHVTAKLRNRKNSMWQAYKEKMQQEAAQKGEQSQDNDATESPAPGAQG
jgi:hypothetical protein